MARGHGHVTLIGNLGRDPDLRYSQNGNPIASASIAVGRRGRDGQELTDWWKVVWFGKSAENAAEWLIKGSRVMVEGEPRIEQYTGQDGVERTSVEVVARTFMNLTPRDEAGRGAPHPAMAGSRGGAGRNDDYDDLDDVPF